MNKNRKNYLLYVMVAMVIAITSIPCQKVTAANETKVSHGKVSYSISVNESYGCFIGNAEPVTVTPGKKYFLTYTVDSVASNTLLGMGLIVTKDNQATEIYSEGTGFMKYTDKDQNMDTMFEVGYTYLISYEMQEDGFHYKVAKAKGDHSEYVDLGDVGKNVISKEIKDGKYFGIFLNGAENYQNQKRCMTAEFSRVYCYDEDGNDIPVTATRNATVYRPKQMKEKSVAHYYEFSLQDATNVYISNRKETEESVLYLSYDVTNVAKQSVAMNGFVVCSSPAEVYPWSHGVLGYEDYAIGKSPLLKSGAHYLIRIEKKTDGVSASVKCTYNGKDEYFGWDAKQFLENYDSATLNYMGIFLGQGYESYVSADFKNVRCYDVNGNNLGIQTNQPELKIEHYGELEDYSMCEAVYYCKDNRTFFFLEDESTIGKMVSGSVTEWGTYSIDDNTRKLNIQLSGKEFSFDYKYTLFTDDEQNEYIRMKDNSVTFINGDKIETQTATAENTYRVTKPENPVKKGNTFQAWCLGDGTEYDFDTVVTEATTLYAKWIDGEGNEYLEMSAQTQGNFLTGISPILISVVVSFVLVAVTAIMIVMMVRKGKRHENN